MDLSRPVILQSSIDCSELIEYKVKQSIAAKRIWLQGGPSTGTGIYTHLVVVLFKEREKDRTEPAIWKWFNRYKTFKMIVYTNNPGSSEETCAFTDIYVMQDQREI